MFLSFKNVFFLSLSLSSAGASLSNDNLLKMIEEMQNTLNGQIGRIEDLEKTTEKLSHEKVIDKFRGERGLKSAKSSERGLKGSKYKDRNICYEKDDSFIDVLTLECYASIDDWYYDGYTDCDGGGRGRRVLTDDESRRNLQEMRGKRDLCGFNDDVSPSLDGFSAGSGALEMAKLDIGAIQIGEK
jgi:hypothetical protein